ncbi:MAG: hypothetical protein ACOC1L_01920 [Bacillota bacterium]
MKKYIQGIVMVFFLVFLVACIETNIGNNDDNTSDDTDIIDDTSDDTDIIDDIGNCEYQYEGYELTWCDDFTGEGDNLNAYGVDLDKWAFQLGTGSQYGLNGWGNNEAQYYREENARVENNRLIMALYHPIVYLMHQC